jgi:hypothetical protein
VRIPLDQDYWLPGSRNYSNGYNTYIGQVVGWAKQAGLDVILDLHWSDKGDLANSKPGQQRMPDKNSVTFWTQVANMFKGDAAVLFELYNEPHDVSWDVWRSGGDSGDGFQAVGMQQLYDTVRATGAKNLVVIGGLNWAFDLSGVPSHKINGDNIVYNTHPYAFGGKMPSDWDKGFGFLTATDPVIATEFGDFDCSQGYYESMMTYCNQHNVSWTAWAWYPGGCGFPAVILDWNGNPNAPGQVIKKALAF